MNIIPNPTAGTWYRSSQVLPPAGMEVLISGSPEEVQLDSHDGTTWMVTGLPVQTFLLWSLPSMPIEWMYEQNQ